MLHFANRPDPIFTAILHEAMDDLASRLSDELLELDEAEELWHAEYPDAAATFRVPLAVYTLLRLLHASHDPHTVYRPTDYHWLLLYACLRGYCAVHNDYTREHLDDLLPVGPYRIGAIDFHELLDLYFWDLDFLTDAETVDALGPDARVAMDLSDEAYSIAQKLPPHGEELRLELVREAPWEDAVVLDPPAGARIERYPPEDDS